MKRNIALSLALVMYLVSTVFSQTNVFQIRKASSKSWGYASTNGKVIIEPKYKVCSAFSEDGFATVMTGGKYQIINVKGEIVNAEVSKLAPNYNSWTGVPQKFFNGLLITSKSSMYGCLNTEGKIVIPIQYDALTHFDGGYALAKRDKQFFVLDINGKETPVEVEKVKGIKHFSEGLGIIEVKGGKWGYVDGNGKVAIEPKFIGVGYFSAGLAWAKTSETAIGFINKKGEWIIEQQFESVRDFDEESGLAMVKLDGNWGYVNTKGEMSYFDETDKTYIFSNGLAIGRKDGKIGFLNNEGQWAIEPKFDAARPFQNGYAAAELNNQWGIIDKKGNWVVQPAYEDIRDVVEVK